MVKLLTELPSDERPVLLTRKELERSKRKTAYKAAKERAKSDPVAIARKAAVKAKAKTARAKAREAQKNDPMVMARKEARKAVDRAARKAARERQKTANEGEMRARRSSSDETLRSSVHTASTMPESTPAPRRRRSSK